MNDEEPSVSRRSSYSSRRSYSAARSSKSSRGKKNKKNKKGGNKSVTIKSGDTLSEIAQRNHTTVAKLRKLNKISGNNIRAGKKLKVK